MNDSLTNVNSWVVNSMLFMGSKKDIFIINQIRDSSCKFMSNQEHIFST